MCLAFAYCIGIHWGLIGVATAYVAYTYTRAIQHNNDSSINYYGYTVRPSNALGEIAFSLLVAPALYCGVWVLLPRGKQTLIEHFSYLRLAFNTPSNLGLREGFFHKENL